MSDKKSIRLRNKEISHIMYLLSKQDYDQGLDLNSGLIKKLEIAKSTKPSVIDAAEFHRLSRG